MVQYSPSMFASAMACTSSETIVKTIMAQGRSLHMQVTVEGVETDQQAQFVRGISADQVQGYYFGRPVPETDLAAGVLADFQRATAPEPQPAAPAAEFKRAADPTGLRQTSAGLARTSPA
jgi:predicted signal transduction protein with EAL and GGDEF domain